MNEDVRALQLRFSKTRECWSLKVNWRLRFSLLSIILADLLENRDLLQRVQEVMVVIGDWKISRSVLCVSVFQGSLLVVVIMIDGSE